MNELPVGWAKIEIGNVCNFEYGKSLTKEKRDENGQYAVYGSNGIVGKHSTFLIDEPCLIIGRKGAAGEVHLSLTPCYPIDTTYFVRKPNIYDLKFFFYSLKFARLSVFEKSTAIPGLNRNDAYSKIITLPPLPEQHRIVAKIEELFSSLDKGIESLKTAQQQLKVYRQAVLKWAFAGKFTNANVKEGVLPEGWKKMKISDVAEIIGGYAFNSNDFKKEGKYQVLRIGNLRPGVIRCNLNPVFLDEVDNNVLLKSNLKPNDIIISQTGTKGKRDYGFTALIFKSNFLLNQRLSAIRCDHLCLPKYFLYFSWTDFFKNQFFKNETGNVGQGNVGIKAITESIIYLPTLPEQHRIVAEIETRLSVCDKLEESIITSLTQAEALRQSILKKAFEGKLVPQDPNDEPASVLLERIRAERAQQQTESSEKKQSIKEVKKTKVRK